MNEKIFLSDETEERLRRYVDLLIAANERARLTGPSDAETLWREHVLDAARGLPYLPQCGSFVDVGTGGGLPGIVWAICRPDLRAVLVDSVAKKCAALDAMARELGCMNVAVICSRAEEMTKPGADSLRESFDLAAARGVAHAGVVAEYLSPFGKVGGTLLAFKGQKVREEIEDISPQAWNRLGLAPPKLDGYTLETTGEPKELVIATWRKHQPCPKKFPRRTGLADKTPWWA